MTDSEKFDFDSILDEDSEDTGDDFFLFDPLTENSTPPEISDIPDDEIISGKDNTEEDYSSQKRSSADFSPDMDALLLTAQSSMIVEAMKLISLHDFKSKNLSVFSEAIKGIDLYKKILDRNPDGFKKLTAILSSDQDCMDVLKITFNLFKNVTGELPDSDHQKLKAFDVINERLKNAYNKSLISSSIVNIKKYFLLSGTIDTAKIETEFKNDPAGLKKKVAYFVRNINIGRDMIKSGNAEIIKGMKGKELNVFIIKSSQMLIHYFGLTGETELQSFYRRLHENFRKYFVIR